MPSKVVITATKGPNAGNQYCFDSRAIVIVGKEDDCHWRFNKEEYRTVSRHHCLIEVNPPEACLRDLKSRNGTLINGEEVQGRRAENENAPTHVETDTPVHPLRHGDVVTLCRKTQAEYHITIHEPTLCVGCTDEIPEDQKPACLQSTGVYVCANCRRRDSTKVPAPPLSATVHCMRCGTAVPQAAGQPFRGQLVCAACHADKEKNARDLLTRARSGQKELVAIKDYELEKQLGVGGMGAVYLTRHRATRAKAALKIMLPRVAINKRNRSKFQREIDITRSLRHSNLIELYDQGIFEGIFFFTMEFCPGGSVHDYFKKHGKPLAIEDALDIILQALEGLEHAHRAEVQWQTADGKPMTSRGIVHRDLKPQNLLLTTAGGKRIVKISDHGLAKAFDAAGLSGHTLDGESCGTPVFMAREQLNSKEAKPSVDVWAMAATLYYLLTGEFARPFPKRPSKSFDIWQCILEEDAVPIIERNPRLPKRLAQAIDAALVERPALQFKDAGAWKQALLKAL